MNDYVFSFDKVSRFIYLFIYWNVFLLASLSIMKSQQRTNSYFVQFCQQVWTIYRKQKTMNYPDGAKRNVLSCFLTVSKVQFITLERSASGIVFHSVGPVWAKALFCIMFSIRIGTVQFNNTGILFYSNILIFSASDWLHNTTSGGCSLLWLAT